MSDNGPSKNELYAELDRRQARIDELERELGRAALKGEEART